MTGRARDGLARHFAALPNRPHTIRYEDDPAPCDAPHQTAPRFSGRLLRHAPSAVPPTFAPLAALVRPAAALPHHPSTAQYEIRRASGYGDIGGCRGGRGGRRELPGHGTRGSGCVRPVPAAWLRRAEGNDQRAAVLIVSWKAVMHDKQ